MKRITWPRGDRIGGCRSGNRRGVIGAWVIVSLLSLIGIAALVVDIGRLVVVAQHVQDVADASALACASGLPDLQLANQRLQQMVQANNQEMPGFAVSFSPGSDVRYYGAGQTVAGYGALEADEQACEVTCRSTVEYTFARIFGMEQATVTRSATALSQPASGGGGSGGGGVFFAEESADHLWGVVINGSHQTVDGDIHSNTRVVVNGSHQAVSGQIRYRNECAINGMHQDIGDQVETDIEPYPIDYQWDDYFYSGPYDYTYTDPTFSGSNQSLPSGNWRVYGDLTVNGSSFDAYDSKIMVDGNININGAGFEAHNCLLMATGNINVAGAQIDFDECTFIARQSIVMNSALKESSFNRACDGLFAMAEGPGGITYNGAQQQTEGIIFAPNGPVTYNGAYQEVYNGGIAAETITVNGAHGSFNPHDEYGLDGPSAGDRMVSLIR